MWITNEYQFQFNSQKFYDLQKEYKNQFDSIWNWVRLSCDWKVIALHTQRRTQFEYSLDCNKHHLSILILYEGSLGNTQSKLKDRIFRIIRLYSIDFNMKTRNWWQTHIHRQQYSWDILHRRTILDGVTSVWCSTHSKHESSKKKQTWNKIKWETCLKGKRKRANRQIEYTFYYRNENRYMSLSELNFKRSCKMLIPTMGGDNLISNCAVRMFNDW